MSGKLFLLFVYFFAENPNHAKKWILTTSLFPGCVHIVLSFVTLEAGPSRLEEVPPTAHTTIVIL